MRAAAVQLLAAWAAGGVANCGNLALLGAGPVLARLCRRAGVHWQVQCNVLFAVLCIVSCHVRNGNMACLLWMSGTLPIQSLPRAAALSPKGKVSSQKNVGCAAAGPACGFSPV